MRTSLLPLLVLPLGLVLPSTPARAQGSDNCATPQVIAGTGSFVFNSLAATTGAQGQSEVLCNFFGTTGIVQDVWFTWSAPAHGFAVLSLCAGTSPAFDTKVAVYPGSACPAGGSALACNDDSCNLVSFLGFPCTAGTSYTFQIGNFPGAGGSSGSFALAIGSPPPPSPPCTSTGPDVIVGDLMDTENYAPVGGIDALAIGTYSCNIGDTQLNWIANNANHPVIAQTLYRYKVVAGAGRFEQVGMSWLKHGFTALQDPLCCPTCTPSGTGARLGIGCADPYTAGLNGSQPSLGPHWQVNATTGVFTYPPSNPAWSGTVARRLQVALADLEVTGAPGAARYFGEGQYVTRDDALAGNHDNNASWREIVVTAGPSNYNLDLQGFTARGQSAIEAWPQIEADVRLHPVQADGKLIVASKATYLDAGQWHYEYAVYNMNSDRSVGTFSVPIPAGVTVSNIGFHDVAYHDGDGPGNVNYSGLDWTSALAGGFLTWSTESQSVNDSANAIRWGATANFRFDANTPPQSGTLALGMWKPGTPSSYNAPGDVPGGNAFASFCAGDGSLLPCPCANDGAAGHGCASSVFAAGALLSGSGIASVTNDTVVLVAANLPGRLGVFLQGDAQSPPVLVDDGLGCVSGALVFLGTLPVGGNVAVLPESGGLWLSVRGAVPPAGGTYQYQCLYRNPAPAFCPPSTSNRTNGVSVTWAP